MKRCVGFFLILLGLSSFVLAGSSMSTNFVIRSSDDAFVEEGGIDEGYLFLCYSFWIVVALVIVYILFKLNLRKFVGLSKKKVVGKKKRI